MTKFLLSCLIACIAFSASAQIKKNAFLLGGDIYFGGAHDNYSGGSSSRLLRSEATVSVGTAVKENSVVGLNLGYSPIWIKQSYNNGSSETIKQARYNVGAFYRKYKKVATDLYFLAQLDANYAYNGPSKNSSGNNLDYHYSLVSAAFSPGISYRLYKKLYVEMLMNDVVNFQYREAESKDQSGSSKQTQLGFNTSLNWNTLSSFSIGFRFII